MLPAELQKLPVQPVLLPLPVLAEALQYQAEEPAPVQVLRDALIVQLTGPAVLRPVQLT